MKTYIFRSTKTCVDCGVTMVLVHGNRLRCVPCGDVFRRTVTIQRAATWNKTNKSRRHHEKVKRTFGLTRGQYEEMFASQDGRCQICHQTQPRWLSVDHDHLTGQIRGLLCAKCNSALGMIDDSVFVLESMRSYMMKYRSRKAS